MPAVLVHGVPETPAIWNQLRAHLSRDDVLTLQLPGFGCPRPPGFASTKEEYVDWLVEQLAGLQSEGPLDLVGHDWGGALVLRLVSIRPDLVRSWVTDTAGIGHVDFEWHELAKIWQTPGAGEEFWEGQLAVTEADRGGAFEAFGVPHDEAVALASHIDQTMVTSILDLYRSATAVGKEWGPEFRDIPAPGLTLIAMDDFLLDVDRAKSAAANAGSGVAELPGVGHWWMTQDAANGAAVLEEFWKTVS